ncbi:hypothetical protein GGG17_12105 [Arsenicicoccus sp. MKL-02]|uniref:Uncharacterized protein n=1 Tax=Arsenicicoccus cauae TaxID=2663847 RepID=A0A6I3IFA4_9MICO|nr:hypothetical protein [Arsenicicoccus cauae]
MTGPSRLHANAALTPRHRMIVARLVVDDGWPIGPCPRFLDTGAGPHSLREPAALLTIDQRPRAVHLARSSEARGATPPR